MAADRIWNCLMDALVAVGGKHFPPVLKVPGYVLLTAALLAVVVLAGLCWFLTGRHFGVFGACGGHRTAMESASDIAFRRLDNARIYNDNYYDDDYPDDVRLATPSAVSQAPSLTIEQQYATAAAEAEAEVEALCNETKEPSYVRVC